MSKRHERFAIRPKRKLVPVPSNQEASTAIDDWPEVLPGESFEAVEANWASPGVNEFDLGWKVPPKRSSLPSSSSHAPHSNEPSRKSQRRRFDPFDDRVVPKQPYDGVLSAFNKGAWEKGWKIHMSTMGVMPVEFPELSFHVSSETSAQRVVNWDGFQCDCPRYAVCSHLIAVGLHLELKDDVDWLPLIIEAQVRDAVAEADVYDVNGNVRPTKVNATLDPDKAMKAVFVRIWEVMSKSLIVPSDVLRAALNALSRSAYRHRRYIAAVNTLVNANQSQAQAPELPPPPPNQWDVVDVDAIDDASNDETVEEKSLLPIDLMETLQYCQPEDGANILRAAPTESLLALIDHVKGVGITKTKDELSFSEQGLMCIKGLYLTEQAAEIEQLVHEVGKGSVVCNDTESLLTRLAEMNYHGVFLTFPPLMNHPKFRLLPLLQEKDHDNVQDELRYQSLINAIGCPSPQFDPNSTIGLIPNETLNPTQAMVTSDDLIALVSSSDLSPSDFVRALATFCWGSRNQDEAREELEEVVKLLMIKDDLARFLQGCLVIAFSHIQLLRMLFWCVDLKRAPKEVIASMQLQSSVMTKALVVWCSASGISPPVQNGIAPAVQSIPIPRLSPPALTSSTVVECSAKDILSSGNAQALVAKIRREEFGVDVDHSSLNQKQQSRLTRTIRRIVEDLYASNTQVVSELLQNADDCFYTSEPQCVIALDIEHGLGVSYNEVGFTERDLRSLCDIAASSKEGNEHQLGRFGVGFKSSFMIADEAYIFSKGLRIKFVSPEASDEIPFVCPVWVEDDKAAVIPEHLGRILDKNTVIWLPACRGKKQRLIDIADYLARTSGEDLVLFLRKIQALTIVTSDRTIKVSRENTEDCVRISDDLGRILNTYIIKKVHQDGLRVQLALPTASIEEGMIYCGMPLQVSGLPVHIDANWAIAVSRETIKGDSSHNARIVDVAAELLAELVSSILFNDSFPDLSSWKEKLVYLPNPEVCIKTMRPLALKAMRLIIAKARFPDAVYRKMRPLSEFRLIPNASDPLLAKVLEFALLRINNGKQKIHLLPSEWYKELGMNEKFRRNMSHFRIPTLKMQDLAGAYHERVDNARWFNLVLIRACLVGDESGDTLLKMPLEMSDGSICSLTECYKIPAVSAPSGISKDERFVFINHWERTLHQLQSEAGVTAKNEFEFVKEKLRSTLSRELGVVLIDENSTSEDIGRAIVGGVLDVQQMRTAKLYHTDRIIRSFNFIAAECPSLIGHVLTQSNHCGWINGKGNRLLSTTASPIYYAPGIIVDPSSNLIHPQYQLNADVIAKLCPQIQPWWNAQGSLVEAATAFMATSDVTKTYNERLLALLCAVRFFYEIGNKTDVPPQALSMMEIDVHGTRTRLSECTVGTLSEGFETLGSEFLCNICGVQSDQSIFGILNLMRSAPPSEEGWIQWRRLCDKLCDITELVPDYPSYHEVRDCLAEKFPNFRILVKDTNNQIRRRKPKACCLGLEERVAIVEPFMIPGIVARNLTQRHRRLYRNAFGVAEIPTRETINAALDLISKALEQSCKKAGISVTSSSVSIDFRWAVCSLIIILRKLMSQHDSISGLSDWVDTVKQVLIPCIPLSSLNDLDHVLRWATLDECFGIPLVATGTFYEDFKNVRPVFEVCNLRHYEGAREPSEALIHLWASQLRFMGSKFLQEIAIERPMELDALKPADDLSRIVKEMILNQIVPLINRNAYLFSAHGDIINFSLLDWRIRNVRIFSCTESSLSIVSRYRQSEALRSVIPPVAIFSEDQVMVIGIFTQSPSVYTSELTFEFFEQLSRLFHQQTSVLPELARNMLVTWRHFISLVNAGSSLEQAANRLSDYVERTFYDESAAVVPAKPIQPTDDEQTTVLAKEFRGEEINLHGIKS